MNNLTYDDIMTTHSITENDHTFNQTNETDTTFDNEFLPSSENKINLACTNARSLAQKIGSLVTLFDENSLHIAMLTETSLTPKNSPPRVLSDLLHGGNIALIRRDRGSRGGGVAIAFNPEKGNFKKYGVNNGDKKSEIVAAVGNIKATKRKIVSIATYLPPSLSAADTSTAISTLIDLIDRAKTDYVDPILFVGGDFNGKDMSRLLSSLSLIHI